MSHPYSVYDDTCRICLKRQCENRVKFDADSDWSNLFHFCTDISVPNAEDKAPKVFCGGCATLLKQYAEFKKLSQKHDALWKKFAINLRSEYTEYIYLNLWQCTYCGEYIPVKFLRVSMPSNDEKVQTTVKDEEDYLPDNYDDGIGFEDVQVTQQSEVTMYYESEVTKIKEEIVDSEELNKSVIEIKPIQVQIVENITLSKKDLKYKYYDVKKGKNRNNYFCKKCGEKICYTKTLLNHVRECYGLTQLKLTKEPVVETTPQLPKSPFIYCGICDFKSEVDNVVTQHFNDHCANNVLNCGLCDFVGSDIAHMVAHRFKHSPPEYRHKKSCPSCLKWYKTLNGIEFHYRSIHLNKPGGLCKICDKSFKNRKAFKYHMIAHDEVHAYICDICKQKYRSRKYLLEHLRVHKRKQAFVCQYCGKNFRKKYNLNLHIECVHTESMSLVCNHCNRIFKNHHTLQMHLKRIIQEKIYICDYCSKGFPTLKTLEKHLIWHSDDRPFACSICNKAYKNKSQLTKHQMAHTGQRYKCTICGKEFVSQGSFKRHQSVHTGIRSVKCLNCNLTFHSKKLMNAHCNRKHPAA